MSADRHWEHQGTSGNQNGQDTLTRMYIFFFPTMDLNPNVFFFMSEILLHIKTSKIVRCVTAMARRAGSVWWGREVRQNT
jgi:hypothetical protein